MRFSGRLAALPALALVGAMVFAHGVRAQAPPKEQLEQAAAARAILAKFDPEMTTPSRQQLHVIYFSPKYVAPPEGCRERLQRVMEHVRAFYAAQMKSYGFGPRTFKLAYAKDKKLLVHFIQGQKPRKHYGGLRVAEVYSADQIDLRRRVWDEVAAALATKGISFAKEWSITFCNFTRLENNKLTGFVYPVSPHPSKQAIMRDTPFFDTLNMPDKKREFEYVEHGILKVGRFSSNDIGTAAHEIGHAFARLPHDIGTAADDKRGGSIMCYPNSTYGEELRGEGPGAIFSLSAVIRLASQPMFSGTQKQLGQPVKAKFLDLKATQAGKEFQLHGRVVSSIRCYAVCGYVLPDGGNGYYTRSSVAIPDGSGRFTLRCRDLAAGKPGSLSLAACFVNGASSIDQPALPYVVREDGRPDVSDLNLSVALEPLLVAWQKKDRAAFKMANQRVVAGRPEIDSVAIWARHIAAAFDDKPLHPRPGRAAPGLAQVFLSDCEWSHARVFFFRPTRNHWPHRNDVAFPDYFLSVGSKRFLHGLCAHAPSNYQFTLDGKWMRLRGLAGLALEGGSVVFVIRGDGRELWRSPLIKGIKTVPFDVSVVGIRGLQMIVEDGGDGQDFDAAHWLEPKLFRGRPELERIRAAADKEDVAAMTDLGQLYLSANGVPPDEAEGARWLRKAADKGHADAQMRLALLYSQGRGVPGDQLEAIRWHRKAANQGSVDAQAYLGFIHMFGQGVKKNEAEGVAWLRKAAEKGHDLAQQGLSEAYADGRGVAKNDVEALKWCRKSAEQGFPLAQLILGWRYHVGNGLKQNSAEAAKWCRKAAEQENAAAQRSLGILYENGDGVPRSLVQAVRWYIKAADQGDVEAKNALKRIDGK